jgi:hypothetical protein
MKSAIRNLSLLHLVGNALVLWCAYYWLGVGESSAGALTWSALVALACVCAALWLHGAALAQFRGSPAPLKAALRHLLPLIAVALAAAGIYALLMWWQARSPDKAFKIASYITLKLRKPLKPATVEHIFGVGFWIVRWAVVPVFLLPLAAAVAGQGWSGFGAGFWRMARRWLYWIETPALLVCALWAPRKLLAWTPTMHSFGMEMTSFVARALAAYLLLTAALLALEFFTGRGSASAGNPAVSQPVTVASP